MKKSVLIFFLLISTTIFSQSKKKETIIVLASKFKMYSCGDFNRSIYFDTGISMLSPKVKEKLDAIAQRIITVFPITNFSVEGHTDNQEKRNQKLSEKRAKNVIEYLISKGVKSIRLSSTGYGKEYPIADNETKEGRTQNRRVEIRLVN